MIGIGVSTLDIVSLVDRFPATEMVQQSKETTILGGGPVATAIVTLAKLGARTAMLDVLGDDWRGLLILQEFLNYGVSVAYVHTSTGCTSSMATVIVRKGDGDRSIIFTPGSAPDLSQDDISLEIISSSKILHMNGRHFQACLKACELAKQCDVTISFDGGANRFRDELRRLVPLTDICIVARNFAEEYAERTSIEAAAHVFLSAGPELVVITDGSQGSWIFQKTGGSFHQAAYGVTDSVDTTGCGDSYHGAFLFGLLQGMDLRDTSSLASAAAALNTRGLGGRAALPNLEEIESFLCGRIG